MKQIYTSKSAIKALATFFITACSSSLFSQVAITVPQLTLTACSTFPTQPDTLSDIVINELAANDISGSGTLILSAPANFVFTDAGNASADGTEITGVGITLTDSVTLTLSFTVAGTAELNIITLSGIVVKGINAATGPVVVTRTGGTSIINSDVNGTVHATLTSASLGGGAPAAPLAQSAYIVSYTSFNAVWNDVLGATQYYLDVSSSSSFSTTIAGYNNLNVGYVTTFNVSGLSMGSTYYYRVRAGNGLCGTIGSNSNTISVNISNVPPDVWPGDANNDSLVNNVDLLSVGLHYAQVGVPRATINNAWQAYPAINWGGPLQSNNEDIKHADCNGDGIIDANDTLAINQNYSLTHVIQTNSPSWNQERSNSDMYFIISSSAYTAGDWVNVEVWLGEQMNPINALYGVAFDIHYNSSLVQSGTESITYPSANWIGAPGTEAITISKANPLANTTHGAISRITHTSVTGFGKIAEFKFQLANSLTQVDTMRFSVSSITAVDNMGGSIPLTTGIDSISVNPLSTGILAAQQGNTISIAPNPFTSSTVITFASEVNDATLKVIDILGREVKSMPVSGKSVVLEKGELNFGTYSVMIVSKQNTIVATEKVVIQ